MCAGACVDVKEGERVCEEEVGSRIFAKKPKKNLNLCGNISSLLSLLFFGLRTKNIFHQLLAFSFFLSLLLHSRRTTFEIQMRKKEPEYFHFLTCFSFPSVSGKRPLRLVLRVLKHFYVIDKNFVFLPNNSINSFRLPFSFDFYVPRTSLGLIWP